MVTETRVTMSDLRQHLGKLVNRAAYGDERIVLVSHGEPKAVIVGIAEFRRLDARSRQDASSQTRTTEALAAASAVRERIQKWQESHGIRDVEDSTETLRTLREERDAELGSP
jgi:prevent-host-death family protein